MKKRIILVLVFIVTFVSILLFYNLNKPAKTLMVSKHNITDEFVKMNIKENTLTNVSATIILKNDTTDVYIYGEVYTIEKEVNGKWWKLKPIQNIGFHAPAHEIKPDQSIEIPLNWDHYYGILDSGKYRIVKDISLENNPQEDIYIAKEFEIK